MKQKKQKTLILTLKMEEKSKKIAKDTAVIIDDSIKNGVPQEVLNIHCRNFKS